MRLKPSLQIKRQLLRFIMERQYAPNQILPTIEALARTFEVSTKTVQKAIHALSEEGVIEAKRGVGLFVRSLGPQARRGRRIGLVYPNGRDYIALVPYPSSVVQVLKRDLREAGYTLVPCPLAEVDRLVLDEALLKLRLSGLILLEIDNDVLIRDFRETRLPLVSMDYDAYRHGISSVSFDNLFGAFQATKHLLDMGHRHVVFLRPLLRNPINNRSLDTVEDERAKGYRIAMQDAGLPVSVREYENKASFIHQMLLELFARRPAPTGFVCVGTWSAQGIAEDVRSMGFRVPEDVSFVGFGESQVEFAPNRCITTVRLSGEDMGAAAARMMLALIEGDATPQREVLEATLIRHDSVADLRPVAERSVQPFVAAS